MIRPELTIAIPTYNRVKTLKQSLDLAVKYSQGKNIEVLVSDNASTDGTEAYMKEYVYSNPQVAYYRNASNLGFDGNFLNCFSRANGRYVLLLSDDDILMEGAIESILLAIEKSPVFIHLNTCGIKNDNNLEFTKPRFEESGLIEFDDRNQFLEKVGIYLTFVSSLVFNLEYIRQVDNPEQYFGTTLLQSYMVFETMKNDGLYLIDTYNCVAARPNIKVSYDLYNTWIKEYSILMLETGEKCGFDINVIKYVLERDLDTTVYNFVLSFRLTCENEASWNKEGAWKYICMFPKLMKKYKVAMNCTKPVLRCIGFAERLKNKIKR